MNSTTKKYLFTHIPKTAGKMITSLISKQFSEDERLIFLFDDSFLWKKHKFTKEGTYDRCRFFAGHLSYEHIKEIQPDYLFTFSRDPIDRVLSNYFYWRQEGLNDKIKDFEGNYCPLIDPNLSWEEDLVRHLRNPNHSFKSLELSNLQTWQLAYNLYKRDKFSDTEALAAAKKHIGDFDFIGTYTHLKSDLERLHQSEGWSFTGEIPQINPTKKRKTTGEIDSSLKDEIYNANKLDIELYNILS